jgi:MFS family permease
VSGKGLGPRFRRLWVASTVSNLADGMFLVALPLVAVQFTRSPTLVAGVKVALTLPWLLLVLPAGALADRLDRRQAMVRMDALRIVLLLVLAGAAVFDGLSLPLLYAAAFLLGTAETMFDTSSQSILPMVVEREDLGRANGRLYGAQVVMNEFVGTPLGSALVGLAVASAFVAPAALYVVAIVALLMIGGGSFRPPARDGTTMRTDIVEGLRYLWSRPVLRTLAVLVSVLNAANTAFFSVFVLFAVGEASPMGLREFGFGLLMTTVAVGAVSASLVVERLQARMRASRLLALCIAATAASFAVPVLTAAPVLVGLALAASGFFVMVFNVVGVSLRQELVPSELLGRVNASYQLMASGTMPVGALLGGMLAEALGLRGLFAVLVVLVLVSTVPTRQLTRERIAEMRDEARRRG